MRRSARLREIVVVIVMILVAVLARFVLRVTVLFVRGLGELRRTTNRPSAEVAPEGLEDEAHHVEGGEGRREDAHRPEHPRCPGRPLPGRRRVRELHTCGRLDEHAREDLVLREEAAREREADDAERGREERPVRERHVLPQAAHVPHVLRGRFVVDASVHRMDDAAGAEEEAGLEERVGEDVEEAGREGADADAEHHEAELAHGGVGEDAS